MTKFSPLLHLACVVPPWEHIQNKDCSFSQGPRWYEQIHSSLSAGHRAVVNFWPSQNVNEKDVLLCSCCYLEEKAMAPHSSTLAWQIPWTEEPGGLQSMRSLRVGHDWATSLSLFTFHFHALEKEMSTHSSVLAWRIPGTGEPGGLPSLGLHRVGHDWSDLAAAAAVIWRELLLQPSLTIPEDMSSMDLARLIFRSNDIMPERQVA